MTKRLGCYSGPTQNTVEMGSSSRCAPCPHSDSDEPFQCMFPIVPVQRLGCDLRQAVCAPVQAFFLGFNACSTYT